MSMRRSDLPSDAAGAEAEEEAGIEPVMRLFQGLCPEASQPVKNQDDGARGFGGPAPHCSRTCFKVFKSCCTRPASSSNLSSDISGNRNSVKSTSQPDWFDSTRSGT